MSELPLPAALDSPRLRLHPLDAAARCDLADALQAHGCRWPGAPHGRGDAAGPTADAWPGEGWPADGPHDRPAVLQLGESARAAEARAALGRATRPWCFALFDRHDPPPHPGRDARRRAGIGHPPLAGAAGGVGLWQLDRANRRAELSFALRPDRRGSGLMHEALGALLAVVFDPPAGSAWAALALHRLEARPPAGDYPACRCLERHGFRLEGVLRERWWCDGQPVDEAVYALHRPAWHRRPVPGARGVFDGAVYALSRAELAAWLAMRIALWPGTSADAHQAEMAQQLADPRQYLVLGAFDGTGDLAGFAEVGLRHDPVVGVDCTPVGFLEGLFVAPTWRRRGVARALVRAALGWSREHAARGFASNVLLDNPASLALHRALGFVETGRVAYFSWPAEPPAGWPAP